jgi:hypothetical protein
MGVQVVLMQHSFAKHWASEVQKISCTQTPLSQWVPAPQGPHSKPHTGSGPHSKLPQDMPVHTPFRQHWVTMQSAFVWQPVASHWHVVILHS